MTQPNLSEIQAKLLEEHDLPALFTLLSEKAIAEKLHWSPTPSELKECYLHFWRNDPDEKNYLLTVGTHTVGWLKLNGFSAKDALWISMLAVSPDFQGQNIGTWALTFSEEAAREHGHSQLCVKTTFDNLDAIAFYIRRGFRLDSYDKRQQKYTFLKML